MKLEKLHATQKHDQIERILVIFNTSENSHTFVRGFFFVVTDKFELWKPKNYMQLDQNPVVLHIDSYRVSLSFIDDNRPTGIVRNTTMSRLFR